MMHIRSLCRAEAALPFSRAPVCPVSLDLMHTSLRNLNTFTGSSCQIVHSMVETPTNPGNYSSAIDWDRGHLETKKQVPLKCSHCVAKGTNNNATNSYFAQHHIYLCSPAVVTTVLTSSLAYQVPTHTWGQGLTSSVFDLS